MANKANLKSFDDIFKTSEQRTTEENEEKVSGMPTTLSISKLKPFSKHLFKLYENEKMLGLADSIKEQGVIVPILVRPIVMKNMITKSWHAIIVYRHQGLLR